MSRSNLQMSLKRTSAYGASSLSSNPGILEAAANCATFEDKPSLPQSYCWVVGMILNTGEVIFYSMVCNLSGILGEKEKEEGDGCQS